MPTMPKKNIHESGGRTGWQMARVGNCEMKKSSKGDRYYNVALETPGGDFLCYDVLMLEGPGNGIGFAKLFALGAAEDLGDEVRFDTAEEIIGKRAWVYVGTETWQGKRRRKVDIAEGNAGYLAEHETPPTDDPDDGYGPDIPYGPPDDGAPPVDEADYGF